MFELGRILEWGEEYEKARALYWYAAAQANLGLFNTNAIAAAQIAEARHVHWVMNGRQERRD